MILSPGAFSPAKSPYAAHCGVTSLQLVVVNQGLSLPELAPWTHAAVPDLPSLQRDGDASGVLAIGSFENAVSARAGAADEPVIAVIHPFLTEEQHEYLTQQGVIFVQGRTLPDLIRTTRSIVTDCDDLTAALKGGADPDAGKTCYGYSLYPHPESIDADIVAQKWHEAVLELDLTTPVQNEPIRLFVGQPNRTIAPLSALFGEWPSPRRSLPLSNEDKKNITDIFLYAKHESAKDWAAYSKDIAVRIVSRLPVDYPLSLTTSTAFIPCFSAHRIKPEDDGTFSYDLAADFNDLSQETKADLKEKSAHVLEKVRRIQTARRLARFNKVDMGRRHGPLDAERIVVLGRDNDEPAYINSNPLNLSDIDVIKAALREHPKAHIIFMPGSVLKDQTQALSEIQKISPRIKITATRYSISELAHIADAFWTIDSSQGVFALAHKIPVTVFGKPFYANLGLTDDRNDSAAPDNLTIDPDSFLCWYFTSSIQFADVLDGRPLSFDDYVRDFTPYLGKITKDLTNRIVSAALNETCPEKDVVLYLRVLEAHGDRASAQDIIENRASPDRDDPYLDLDIAAIKHLAATGRWRDAIRRSVKTLNTQHIDTKNKNPKVNQSILYIRQQLRTLEETYEFPYALLSQMADSPNTDLQSIALLFESKKFYNSAKVLLDACHKSTQVCAARLRCQLGKGDTVSARATLDQVQETTSDQSVISQLKQTILARENRKLELIPDAEHALSTKTDTDEPRLLLAKLYRETGQNEKACRTLIPLINESAQDLAIRELASMLVAQMRPAAAKGLLEAHLERLPTDALAIRLLADCYSFENNLEAACAQLVRLLKLTPLNIAAHTQLTELEAEITECPGKMGPWSKEFDDFLEDIDEESVETLLAKGRTRLQVHDFETLKDNCRRAMELFPDNANPHIWYAHALTWEPGEKDAELLGTIERHYELALAREHNENAWASLDPVRSFAQLGHLDGIRRLVHTMGFEDSEAERERLVIPRYSASLALGDFANAYDSMRYFLRSRILSKYRGQINFVTKIDDVKRTDKVLLLSEGGVGDEIRYSTTYPELANRFYNATISVDQRLFTLFKRSYPMIKTFVPLQRLDRKRLDKTMLPEIDKLPDRELAPFADNKVWKLAQEVDAVLPVVCTLADLRKTSKDFTPGHKVRLKPDPERVAYWAERLAPYRNRLIVGATWTSSMRQYQRVGNYLTHQEMAPLFTAPGAVFINFQYDDISDELNWARDALGVEIIDFPELDKRDDFEGMAALIANLDLFIGTGTTATEFAAILGCPTIYASPANMNAYRNPAGTETDHYFDNMTFIRPIPATDRKTMIDRIEELLKQAIAEKLRISANEQNGGHQA